jgi:ABC-type sugar transport system ATPase subunit
VPAASFFEGQAVERDGQLLFESPGLTFAMAEPWRSALAGRGGEVLVAGIRPEHWEWGQPGQARGLAGAPGRVEWIECTGPRSFAHVRIGDQLVVTLSGKRAPSVGEEARLQPDPERVLFFDRATGRSL